MQNAVGRQCVKHMWRVCSRVQRCSAPTWAGTRVRANMCESVCAELIQKGHAMFQQAEQEGRLLLANMALALPPSQGNSQAAHAEPYATFWINKQNDVASSFDAAKCNSQRQGGPPCVPMNLSSVRCVSLWAITTPFYLKASVLPQAMFGASSAAW